ncbi:MAG: DNA mismatch repair protein MutS [Firmicutes bacterium]|uniref:DNA mismatch repair protein MutS n=1 Tax=Sulfobacillus benefaciens TaxID=453960 RepID=A0A2T2WVL4_9FIRM|nr:DNA mismatch repair protein MutS [Bacillota bacterium]PSR26281.1 MAG: DNA mismatch repair protein MutS [Sulfobacillus benefaciens]HBQ95162.1 DNA mismatch repair protein MutS [Sulfobacillus sp.]
MSLFSILYPENYDRPASDPLQAPEFFSDLNLDQITQAITDRKASYHLNSVFYTPLNEVDPVRYRQEIMRDLENPELAGVFRSFAQSMRAMRERLAQLDKMYYPYQQKAWFLDAVELYGDAVVKLLQDLTSCQFTARGLALFQQYLDGYVGSDSFRALRSDTHRMKQELARVRYSLRIKGNRVDVRPYHEEPDYSQEVRQTFEKFSQGAVKSYLVRFPQGPDMNQLEGRILERVAQLFPDVFGNVDRYCVNHADYMDETLAVFDREIQFYLATLEFIEPLKQAGLPFCYPHLSSSRKAVSVQEAFDLALASKLTQEQASVVCNDVLLKDSERILVVTGPNQGGKTTFSRMVGQLHYLARLGCPVPGHSARLFLCDKILTHFEKEENTASLRGKLQDDLIRIKDIMSEATGDSLIILNEIFTSTSLKDASFLSYKILQQILERDALCVWVTFIDELASFNDKTVSVVGSVVPEQPALRTYKLVRKPADGLAYALAIAEKHRVTYRWLKERII